MTDKFKKDAFYFSHDANAHDDTKVIQLIEQLGLEGYGIFWILIETLRQEADYKAPLCVLPGLSRRYNTSIEKVKAVIINFQLFNQDDQYFWSESLNRRMAEREEIKINAIKAANIRWHKDKLALISGSNASALPEYYNSNSNVKPEQSLPNAIKERKGKEIKGKEIKGKESKQKGIPAADYEDIIFKNNFESLRATYPDMDYDNEFLRFKAYWNDGTEWLKRPNQAWLNWLEKARQIKKDHAPASSGSNGNGHKNPFSDIKPVYSAPAPELN